MTRLGRPEPSWSAASTPMPARATPASLYATPATMATSVKEREPLACEARAPLLRYSLFGCVSLATKRSIQPSPSKSSMATPSAFDVGSSRPATVVTSSKVPSPRLRYSTELEPWYDSGVQYDLLLPSSVHTRSFSIDQST